MNSILLVSVLCVALVNCDSISIFGTGVNNDGTTTAGGFVDPHYNIVSSPSSSSPVPAYVDFDTSPWAYADHSNSQWIGPSQRSEDSFPVATYVYQTTFDLTGLDPSTASLHGVIAADDNVDIILNGVDTGAGCTACYNSGTSFAINGGFISGVNTLKFSVFNSGGPSGLQVAIAGNANTLDPDAFCASVDVSAWTYGQGYYCWNNDVGFLQCWTDTQFRSAYQPCPQGTSCNSACGYGVECSNHGQSSPCI